MFWSSRIYLVALSVVLASGQHTWAAADQTPKQPAGAAIEQAIAMVKPSLVRIAVVWTEYEQGREIKYEASGSGTIISTNGYIITNHHVAGRAARLMCVMSNNEEIEATLIGTDALSDIAVIQLKGAPGRQFPAAAFGDSDALNVGDPVMAMGSPLALSQSVTLGIVSNLKMVMPRAFRSGGSFVLDGEDVGSMVRWIAHDASIYPGNSGGPLVNMHGEIVGINEISFGLSGAIPGNLARRVADQIIEHGSVQRSWLGVDVQPLLKDGPSASGVLIGGVEDGSPAARAGLLAGDILMQLDGKPVSVRFDEEIPLFNRDGVGAAGRQASGFGRAARLADGQPEIDHW